MVTSVIIGLAVGIASLLFIVDEEEAQKVFKEMDEDEK